MNQPTFSIITINYNLTDKVLCLWKSLQTYAPKGNWEFIVVDNASRPDQLASLKTGLSDTQNTHIIPLQKNLGFGGGYGEGVQFAHGHYLAIINPDIELTSNCLDQLAQKINEKTKIVAPQLINPDGSLQQNARAFPTLLSMFGRRIGLENKTLKTLQKPMKVDWLQGSFMVTEHDFFTQRLQGFDPRFFLFLEDTDLCRRTWMMGHEVQLIPEFTAIHGRERLSGHDVWTSLRKKTFWIHVFSAVKYFWKWRFTNTKCQSSNKKEKH